MKFTAEFTFRATFTGCYCCTALVTWNLLCASYITLYCFAMLYSPTTHTYVRRLLTVHFDANCCIIHTTAIGKLTAEQR